MNVRKGNKADCAVFFRREGCEHVGTLEFLFQFFNQRIETLANLLRRRLLRLSGLRSLALLAHAVKSELQDLGY